jgi:hypothetical protein
VKRQRTIAAKLPTIITRAATLAAGQWQRVERPGEPPPFQTFVAISTATLTTTFVNVLPPWAPVTEQLTFEPGQYVECLKPIRLLEP